MWVCVCIFLVLHMGVIWSFVIPCLHTHTLLVFSCFVVFLFVWTKCTLAGAKTWSVFFSLVLSSWVSCTLSIRPSQTYNILLVLSTGKNFLLANRHRFDLLQHPACDWPLDLAQRGRIRFTVIPDVSVFRGCVDCC